MTRTAAHKHVYKKLRAYTWLYSVFVAVAALVVLFVFVFHTVRIDDNGMADTIASGDIVLFSGISKHIKMPARGTIVAYETEGGAAEIGRIVALPFEEVTVREGRVYINGKLMVEEYATDALTDMETIKLEKGSFFVLPDARESLLLTPENAATLVTTFDRIIGTAAIRVAPWSRIAIFG